MPQDKISAALREHVALLEHLCGEQSSALTAFASRVVETFHQGGRLLICGGGGLGPIANHLANLFLHRLSFDRPLLPAVSLNENQTLAAALLQENQGRQFFARQLRAISGDADIVLLLGDLHRDPVLGEALTAARQQGCTIAVVLPKGEPEAGPNPDFLFRLNTDSAARVAESSLFWGHLLCELVEGELFGL